MMIMFSLLTWGLHDPIVSSSPPEDLFPQKVWRKVTPTREIITEKTSQIMVPLSPHPHQEQGLPGEDSILQLGYPVGKIL